MSPSAAELYRVLFTIVPAADALPSLALSGEERKALSGTATRRAPRLVRAVCRALREDPDLFAEVAVCPDDLSARQARALALFALSASLARLADRARDGYLLEQARCVEQSLLVLRYGRAAQALPLAPRARRLTEALRSARAILRLERGPRRVAPSRR